MIGAEHRSGRIRFGDFEVDLDKGELRKDNVRVQIQDQPFQVLVALLEKSGEIVNRQDLIRRLWPEGTHVDFDRGLNAAVTRLRQVLLDSAESPRYVETVARRGYRFVGFATQDQPAGTAADTPAVPAAGEKPRPRRKARLLIAVASGIAACGLGWLAFRPVPQPPAVVPLTTAKGNELYPSLSPDGSTVAFTWNGENEDNLDIYVKAVGSAAALRLTTDTADDLFPSWSPNGRQIAFLKRRAGVEGVYVVSPLGGQEQKLIDFDGDGPPAWDSDGASLIVAKSNPTLQRGNGAGALFRIPVRGGAPTPLIVPKPGDWFRYPAISPSGRELAYVSCSPPRPAPNCYVAVSAIKSGSQTTPNERILDFGPRAFYYGLTWSADGKHIVVSAGTQIGSFLYRVPARGGSAERLEIASVGALYPSVARTGGRLAFSRSHGDEDIWTVQTGHKPKLLIGSSLADRSPDFSPDGRRIAFASARSGDRVAVWLANADGSNPIQLTSGPEEHQGSPRWSPDGRWIAFDAYRADGRWTVKIVDASGGEPRALTGPESNSICPSWSHDGVHVYFASDRSGRFEVWRANVRGGPEEQMTRNGGAVALESADGKTIYYTKSISAGPLFARDLAGSEEARLVDRVAPRAFAPLANGIAYLQSTTPSQNVVRFLELPKRRERDRARIEGLLGLGFAVAPDGSAILYTLVRPPEDDLMLIENFR